MTEQPSLDFSTPPARAHRRDPSTSAAAAARMNETGAAASQREQVYAAVCATPSFTSAELAVKHGLDRHMVGRRLPELREAKLLKDNRDDARFVRTCRVSGAKAVVWVAK